MRCNCCNQPTIIGHYQGHVRIELAINDSDVKFMPMPFLGDYPGAAGYGRHVLRYSGVCTEQAKESSLRAFPESTVIGVVLTDVLDRELHRLL